MAYHFSLRRMLPSGSPKPSFITWILCLWKYIFKMKRKSDILKKKADIKYYLTLFPLYRVNLIQHCKTKTILTHFLKRKHELWGKVNTSSKWILKCFHNHSSMASFWTDLLLEPKTFIFSESCCWEPGALIKLMCWSNSVIALLNIFCLLGFNLSPTQ